MASGSGWSGKANKSAKNRRKRYRAAKLNRNYGKGKTYRRELLPF